MATATQEYGLWIGGEFVEAAETRELTEPATGETLARTAVASTDDVDRAVDAAREALGGAWAKTSPTERSRLLHALADAIVADRKALAELESRNVGKAISSVKAELNQAVENFRFYASAIASISGRSNPIGGSLLFYSLKEPVGVAGQIVPWNYPLTMTTWKLAPALAAGCTIVLEARLRDAALRAPPCGACRRRRLPARRAQRRPRPGQTVGAHLVASSRHRQGRLHGLDLDGRGDHEDGRGGDQARHARARRQEPEHRVRGRRSRERDTERRLVDLLLRRPELRGAFAGAGREARSTTSSSRSSRRRRSR